MDSPECPGLEAGTSLSLRPRQTRAVPATGARPYQADAGARDRGGAREGPRAAWSGPGPMVRLLSRPGAHHTHDGGHTLPWPGHLAGSVLATLCGLWGRPLLPRPRLYRWGSRGADHGAEAHGRAGSSTDSPGLCSGPVAGLTTSRPVPCQDKCLCPRCTLPQVPLRPALPRATSRCVPPGPALPGPPHTAAPQAGPQHVWSPWPVQLCAPASSSRRSPLKPWRGFQATPTLRLSLPVPQTQSLLTTSASLADKSLGPHVPFQGFPLEMSP